jgi:ribosomal-protein-alanine N-acetyltransferase
MVMVRKARLDDAPALLQILERSPGAGPWSADELLAAGRLCLVAELQDHLAGLLVAAADIAGEREILTLAVDPSIRRRGVAAALLRALLADRPSRVFLEVRPSNQAARRLYEKSGFRLAARRPAYYTSPPEDALVMVHEAMAPEAP